ncbi:MAG: FixH family protein [Alphaproteobacteria bacterium]
MDQINQKPEKHLSGWWVFGAFAAFFGVVILVNSFFIYNALYSHSGLVTEDAYKKGLKYNERLQTAKNQPDLAYRFEHKDGLILWQLQDANGKIIDNAEVSVHFFRPVKSGMDFKQKLNHQENGLYSLPVEFPLKGAWEARLKATWDDQTFQTTKNLIIR